MSRQFSTFARFLLLVLAVTAVLTLTVHASPTNQETPRPRFGLEDIPYQASAENSVPNESALSVTAPDILLPWSKVAFQSLRNGSWDIFVGNDDGTGQTAVVASGNAEIHPHLNRGNTKIVYASNSGGDYEIYTANFNGSGQTALTSNTTSDGNPSWSPDGSKIVFEAYRNGEADIYVMNADGTNQVRLTTHPDFDGMPSWSPDGSKIAFVSRRTGGYRIYIMNADGSGQTQLSNQPYSLRPHWSPDGTQIAYDADGDGDGWQDLWRMNADGSSQTLLANVDGENDAWVSGWSPDGSRIVYTFISFTYYQGNWYWTTAYPQTWGSGGSTRLSLNGYDWDAVWQTNDVLPPASHVNTLPAQSPGPIYVRWSSSDGGGSGIKEYDVQVKIGSGSWSNWLVDSTSTSAMYPGIGGQTYAFRVRASDNSYNSESYPSTADTTTTVESLPPLSHITTLPEFSRFDADLSVNWDGTDPGNSGIQTYDVQYQINSGNWINWQTGVGSTTAVLQGGTSGDQYGFRVRAIDRASNQGLWSTGENSGQTKFYTWGIEGNAYDNAGAPVSQVVMTGNPVLLGQSTSDVNGFFGGYTAATSNSYDISWSKSGYTSLPFTTFTNGSDGEYAIIMPPTNNIIADSGFESGDWNSGWQLAGTIPAVITDSIAHTGQHAALLGPPTSFTQGIVPNLPDNFGYFFEKDETDTGHFVYYQIPGGQVNYQKLNANGSWSAVETVLLPESFTIGSEVEVLLEQNGRIHVFWLSSSDYVVAINHIQRNLNGQWTTPQVVNNTLDSYINYHPAVDSSGKLHLFFTRRLSNTNTNALYYITRQTNSWSSPSKLSINDYYDVDDYLTNVQVGSDGTVYLVWIEKISGLQFLYYRERHPVSGWQAAKRLAPEFTIAYNYFSQMKMLIDESDNLYLFGQSFGINEGLYLLEKRANLSWLPPTKLNIPGYDFFIEPEFAVSQSGQLYFACFSFINGVVKVILQIRNEEGIWQAPSELRQESEDANQSYQFGQIALDIDASDTAHVVWSEIIGDTPIPYTVDYQVIYAQKREVGKPEVEEIWSGNGYTDSYYFPPRIYADPSGQPTIFWQASKFAPLHFRTPQAANNAGTYAFSTEITIPNSLSNPVLSFVYDLTGALESKGEQFTVTIDDGSSVETILTSSSPASWQHFWHDMSSWAGKTVTLTFAFVEAANTAVSHVAIDEVTLGTSYPDVWIANNNTEGAISERVTHTISFGNQGGTAAENVTVTFKIPVGLAYRGSNVTPATINSQEITWQLGSIIAKSDNQAIEIELEILPSAPSFSSITGEVSIATSSAELEMLNNQATGSTFVGKETFLPILMNP